MFCFVICEQFYGMTLLVGGRRFSEGTSADREIQRTLMEVLAHVLYSESLLHILGNHCMIVSRFV